MKKIPKTIQIDAYTDDEGRPVCAGCLFDHNRPCWFSWRDRWEIYRPDADCPIWHKQDDTGATQVVVKKLVKCKHCGGTYPPKPLIRSNGELYGYDDGPIVHTYWSLCPVRGPLNTWCPGGGI